MSRKFTLGLVAIVALIALWAAFRPERLFVNTTVNESFPVTSASAENAIASGMFHDGAHKTTGSADVYRLKDGKIVLRLTDFQTSNGPEVHVLLVGAPDALDNDTVKQAVSIDLGSLKGNIGDQNYDIPAGTDLSRYQAATIWCRRFSVNFGTAPLRTGDGHSTPASQTLRSSGAFQSGAHETKGLAMVHELPDGRRFLRLSEFMTSNGPDVQVYLVATGNGKVEDAVKKNAFINVGALKGNVGDQNYEIPAQVDLAKYDDVTVWCRRFGVNFGSASLKPADQGTTAMMMQ
jgi:Electron transfer DM13